VPVAAEGRADHILATLKAINATSAAATAHKQTFQGSGSIGLRRAFCAIALAAMSHLALFVISLRCNDLSAFNAHAAVWRQEVEMAVGDVSRIHT
jgi:hypothetical protein